MMRAYRGYRGLFYLVAILACAAVRSAAQQPAPKEDDFVLRNFRFKSGETLPELRLHYRTLGQPARDAQGRVTNAVLLLHGTSGSSTNFLAANFAGVLFGSGQLLDASRYYLILPDNIGSGRSSRPSDGLRMRFPKYDYDDMVVMQYRLVTEHLGVNHLRLLLGTSMGCMHSFVWSYTYADFMDATMALACLPVEVAGLNRVRRQMMVDMIRSDPEWNGGNYTAQPRTGLRAAIYLSFLIGASQLQTQKNYPTRLAADRYLEEYINAELPKRDANDIIYQYEASRTYDASPHLEQILSPFLHVNSADDMINPAELGIAEREIQKVKKGRFVILPTSDGTRGHATHSQAAVWKQYLEELLKSSAR
jgi:homoserine O-acetyltransferase